MLIATSKRKYLRSTPIVRCCLFEHIQFSMLLFLCVFFFFFHYYYSFRLSIQTFLLFEANQSNSKSNGIRLLLKCDLLFKMKIKASTHKQQSNISVLRNEHLLRFHIIMTIEHRKLTTDKKQKQNFCCSHSNCVKIDQYCETFSQNQMIR